MNDKIAIVGLGPNPLLTETIREQLRRSAGAMPESGATPLVGTGSWLAALRALSSDMHQRSDRPCPTCRPISLLMGEPFGCYAYQAKRNLKTDLVLPTSAANNAICHGRAQP